MRERGPGGRPSKDSVVYKVRVQLPTHGTQPLYYSDRAKAYARAQQAKEDGTLLYFAKYVRQERLDQ